MNNEPNYVNEVLKVILKRIDQRSYESIHLLLPMLSHSYLYQSKGAVPEIYRTALDATSPDAPFFKEEDILALKAPIEEYLEEAG